MKVIDFSYSICIILILSLVSCGPDKPQSDIQELTEEEQPETANNSELLAHLKQSDDAYILPWSLLLNIQFEDVFVDSLGMEVSLPVFNDTIQALKDQIVEVEGFFVPVSETGDETIVILSAYPYAQCFFCGKAGVESIIDVVAPKKLPSIKLDDKIKLKGRLSLNRDNFDFLIYILEEAELIH